MMQRNAYGELPLMVSVGSQASGSTFRAAKRVATEMGVDQEYGAGNGAYNQWTQRYASAKFGRMTLRKILKNNMDTTIFTWQNIKQFGGGGTMWLSNHNEGTVRSLPCYAFDLTSCNNIVNNTLVGGLPMHRLRKAAGNGANTWINASGQAPDGTSSATWNVERSGHNINTQVAYPNDNSILKWASIEMECWGCKNYPTKFTVELCQFNEDVVPAFDGDSNYDEFWDSMIKSYTFNPLLTMQNGYGQKKMKVLRRYNIDIDPTASFENDADPHVKTFKMYFKLNRRCQYDWKFANPNPQTITVNQFDTAQYKQEDQENNTVVHPNARVFLLVRATDYTVKPDAASVNTTNAPSFSMKVRTAHVINS